MEKYYVVDALFFILKEICSLSCKSRDRVLAGMICTKYIAKKNGNEGFNFESAFYMTLRLAALATATNSS
jgi:hypothetical protein